MNEREISDTILLNKIIKTTFPDDAIRKRFLDLLHKIYKNKKYNKVIIFYGLGNNGKTLILNMIINMFDKNSVVLLDNISELDSSLDKKLVIYEDIKLPIKNYIIKHLLSDDTNIYRDHDNDNDNNTVEILESIPKVYIIVSNVNHPSYMFSDFKDMGLIRRLEVIPFNATFVDDVNKINNDQNIYLKDKSLTEWIYNGEHIYALKRILLQ